MNDFVESDYDDRTTEMMICMKEQGYSVTIDGKTVGFSIEVMLDMWDILRDEYGPFPHKY